MPLSPSTTPPSSTLLLPTYLFPTPLLWNTRRCACSRSMVDVSHLAAVAPLTLNVGLAVAVTGLSLAATMDKRFILANLKNLILMASIWMIVMSFHPLPTYLGVLFRLPSGRHPQVVHPLFPKFQWFGAQWSHLSPSTPGRQSQMPSPSH